MVYIAGWLLNYWGLALWYIGLRNKVVFLPVLLYFAVVIVIRYSGTDTFGIYEQMLSSLLSGEIEGFLSGWEPGFLLLSELLLAVTHSEVITLRVIGLLFVILLSVAYIRADKEEQKVIFLYLLPVFGYQLGMNAVRFGLAFALLFLGWQQLRRGKFGQFVFYGFLSVLFHYSALLAFFLLLLQDLKLKDYRVLFGLWVVVLGSSFLLVSRQDYFESKLLLYVSYESPSIFSGLSRSFAVGVVLLGFAFSGGILRRKGTLLLGIATLTVAGQVLAMFTYAGLRVLDIVAASVPLMLLRWFDRAGQTPGRAYWLGLALAGMAGCYFAYRNFLSDYDGQLTGTLTPFLPYRTIFNYNP